MLRLIILLVLLAPSIVMATDYHISNTGSDANLCGNISTVETDPPGDPTQTRATLTGAKACMSGGDRIIVRGGTYTNASGFLTDFPSGSSGNHSVIMAHPSFARPIFQGSCTFDGVSANTCNFARFLTLNVAQRDFITIQGLEIRNLYEVFNFCAINCTTGVTNFHLLNNYLHHTTNVVWGNGHTTFQFHNNIIKGNEFSHVGIGTPNYPPGMNIVYNTGNGTVVEDNVIHDGANGIGVCGGASCGGASNTISGVIVRRNVCYHQGRTDLNPWIGSPTQTSCMHTASNLSSSNPPQFYDNIVYDSGSLANFRGVTISWGLSTDTARIFNNTFYNILHSSALAVEVGATSKPNVQVKNNIAYLVAGGFVGGTQANNRTTNPSFVNAPTDFSLASGSLAIDAGTIEGLPAGRFYNGSLPDQGAHETFTCTSAVAVAGGNFVDVTCQMNLNTPIQPATGQTTWVVKFSGTPRTTVSAIRSVGTDSVVRLQYDGAICAPTDDMTVDFTLGNTSDSALIGGTRNQKLLSFTGLNVNEAACGGGGTPPPSGPHIVYDMTGISGTNVPDSSGNALDGTTVGSPTVVTGINDDALSFVDQVIDYISVPYGSGVNPSTQSVTMCILVSVDSASAYRTYLGTPLGSSQWTFLTTVGSSWSIGVQASDALTNNDFPIQAGWQFPCIVFDASTDTATLWVNAVKGTSAQSVKSYTSFTWAGNFTVGAVSSFPSVEAPGGDVDHFVLYQSALNQSDMNDLYQSLINPSPPQSCTITQITHAWNEPYLDPTSSVRTLSVGSQMNGVAMQVVRGGAVDLMVQMNGTDADCEPFGPRLTQSTDGGSTYFTVNDVDGGALYFRGDDSNNLDVVSGAIASCLSAGGLTEDTGTTNFSSAAIPSITFTEDHCVVQRYKLRASVDAIGKTIYLKVKDQNGNELSGGYTPSLGAQITVTDYKSAAGF